MSLNDSEELSSPMSEDEEEDEDEESDEEEEEEEEDSGSEVEIIEEVQGNGRLPPLQPSSVYVDHGHFLPSLSEQEAAEFSLITPGADMKVNVKHSLIPASLMTGFATCICYCIVKK